MISHLYGQYACLWSWGKLYVNRLINEVICKLSYKWRHLFWVKSQTILWVLFLGWLRCFSSQGLSGNSEMCFLPLRSESGLPGQCDAVGPREWGCPFALVITDQGTVRSAVCTLVPVDTSARGLPLTTLTMKMFRVYLETSLYLLSDGVPSTASALASEDSLNCARQSGAFLQGPRPELRTWPRLGGRWRMPSRLRIWWCFCTVLVLRNGEWILGKKWEGSLDQQATDQKARTWW